MYDVVWNGKFIDIRGNIYFIFSFKIKSNFYIYIEDRPVDVIKKMYSSVFSFSLYF
jgi:hypothetical protein